MPKDNIERAIKKAPGGDAESYDEIRYEGYGPGGVAVIVEVLTDNRNRTASDVRASFTKSGGNLAETGAVSFMFDRVGVVEFDAKVASADAMLEAAIEAGADDVVSSESGHEIYATHGVAARGRQGAGGEVRRAAQGGADLEAAEHGRRSTTSRARSCCKLIEALNEQRRRAERLRQFRGVGRAGGEDERVTDRSVRRSCETDRPTAIARMLN